MGLLQLFIVSTIPVLKVLLVTGLGTYLALHPVDILGEAARKHVNNLVFYVFNPALVASNLAGTITLDGLLKLWFMPLNILITFIIGSIFGWIVVQFTKPPSNLRGLIVGCCAAGNLGNMFLIMIPAVCKEKGSPFGSPDVCQSYGLAYVSLSMAIGAIYLWSYVYNIVRASSTTANEESEKLQISSISVETPPLESCEEPLLPSKPSEETQYLIPSTGFDRKDEQMSVASKFKQRVGKVLGGSSWKALFAPSTIAVVVGFAIGLVPQIRNLMIGHDAPLRVLQDSASLLGDGAIPTVSLIVGANLLKGLKGSGMQKSIVVGIVVVRYIALPMTGTLVIKGAMYMGFVPQDPLYQFILLLQFAVPPAMNIGTITQLFGAGETECSVILLWAYALASISLTLWSTYFMWLVS